MQSRTWIWNTAVCLFAALLMPACSAAFDDNEQQPTMTTFDAPGASHTSAFGGTYPASINPEGAITGYYVDANDVYHGFLRDCDRDGHEKECEDGPATITTFNAPGASTDSFLGTWPTSINPEGAITGWYGDVRDLAHGFLRTPDGTFIEFDPPGATNTLALSINPEGEITGSYTDATYVSHGFLRTPDGTIITFDGPGAGVGVIRNTFPQSINPNGAIAGLYYDGTGSIRGFLRAPDGTIEAFDVPGGAGPNGQTQPVAINPNGAITGFYFEPVHSRDRGFLRNPNGTFITFHAVAGPSCCLTTSPRAINPEGAITGSYGDTRNRNTYGFLRNRNGTITTFNAPGGGTGIFPKSINPKGAITGSYADERGGIHGFLRTQACDRDDHEKECNGDE